MSGDILGCPVTEEGVKQALIPTVKGPGGGGVVDKVPVGVQVWPEDEHTRVEAIGPTSIRGCGEFLSVKELVRVCQNLYK